MIMLFLMLWLYVIVNIYKGSVYTGVPRFIVETLSPATALNDKTIKKDIYQNAGVSEYWIVSPKERAV